MNFQKKLEVRFPKYGIIFRILGGYVTAYIPREHRKSPIYQELLKFLSEAAEKEPIKLDTIQTLENWEALQDWYDAWEIARKSPSADGPHDL